MSIKGSETINKHAIIFSAILVGLLIVQNIASCERVKVEYWDKWGAATGRAGQNEAIETMVQLFNEGQTEIEVEYHCATPEKFIVASAGGVEPDIFGTWNHRTAQYAEQELAMPLDELIERVKLPTRKIINDYLEMGRYKGQIYTLPALPSIITFVWNKTVFNEAGIDASNQPKTWADLENIERKITKYAAGGDIVQMGFSPHYRFGGGGYFWAWLAGGRLHDSQTLDITPTDDRVIRAYELVQEFERRQGTGASAAFRNAAGDHRQAFNSGALAMNIVGSWEAGLIHQAGVDVDYGVGHVPSADGAEPFIMIESDSWMISSGSKHPEAAMEFIKWMYQQDNARRWASSRRQFSVVQAVNTPSFFKALGDPGLDAFNATIQYPTRHVPNIIIWDEYDQALGNATAQILSLASPPSAALRQVEEKIRAMMTTLIE